MPRARAIATLVVHLAAGAAVTVAVSWGLACADVQGPGVWSSQRLRPTAGPVEPELMGGPADGVSVFVYRRPGRILSLSFCYGPEYQPPVGIPGESPEFAEKPPEDLIPRELRATALPWVHGEPWPRSWDTSWCEAAASGWPLAALASSRRVGPSGGRELFDGIAIGGSRAYGDAKFFSQTVPRALPLHPLPLGFAADALLYAGALRGLTTLLGGARRSWRRRRGRCPACGYDRRGLAEGAACPECGRAAGTGALA